MSERPVVFEKVCKRFGKVSALSGVDLAVERGDIYCLLGVNGAGKSTALRILLNRGRPSEGTVLVFGKRSSELRREDFCRIGFVSESQKLYDWMTLGRLIAVVKQWYPSWDDVYCANLIELFRLPTDRKIKSMSRGMRMKTKMLLAFAFQPELVVMDEPFSGLDPIVRQECIEGLLEWAQEGERTLIISSHDVDDVEPICDRVGILHEGRMILDEGLDSLKRRTRQASFHCDEEVALGAFPQSWIQMKQKGRNRGFIDTGYNGEASLARLKETFPNAQNVSFRPLSLRELFVAFVRNSESQLDTRSEL